MKQPGKWLLLATAAAVVAGCGERVLKETGPAATAPAPAEKPKPAASVQVQNVTAEEEVVLKDYLRVDGVLRQGSTYTASINAQVVGVGEYITLSVKGRSYLLNVLLITEDLVRLRAVEQIPLKATTKKL